MSTAPHHGIAEEKKARIAELAQKDRDLNLVQISARLGVSRETVRRVLQLERQARGDR